MQRRFLRTLSHCKRLEQNKAELTRLQVTNRIQGKQIYKTNSRLHRKPTQGQYLKPTADTQHQPKIDLALATAADRMPNTRHSDTTADARTHHMRKASDHVNAAAHPTTESNAIPCETIQSHKFDFDESTPIVLPANTSTSEQDSTC
jgi:hypothetical protein